VGLEKPRTILSCDGPISNDHVGKNHAAIEFSVAALARVIEAEALWFELSPLRGANFKCGDELQLCVVESDNCAALNAQVRAMLRRRET
jgi:hypothetical protein